MVSVSVVIPMYNESKYIARCLESLMQQTMRDFEVILIDDGSTDATVGIADKYKESLPLTILQQQHGWPGKARNRWASVAQGEILIFVDADMFFDSRYIQELIYPITTWEERGTAHGIEKVGNPENIRARSWSIDRIPNPQPRSGVYRAIVKKDFLDAGGFDPSRWYFDDNLSRLNGWRWAKTVMTAICFHNNPTTLAEAYKHSTWVGKSLLAWPEGKSYFTKYRMWLISFVVLLLIGLKLFGGSVILYGVIALLLLLEYAARKRIHKERDLHYLWSIPVLMIVRGLGYIKWMLTALSAKK